MVALLPAPARRQPDRRPQRARPARPGPSDGGPPAPYPGRPLPTAYTAPRLDDPWITVAAPGWACRRPRRLPRQKLHFWRGRLPVRRCGGAAGGAGSAPGPWPDPARRARSAGLFAGPGM